MLLESSLKELYNSHALGEQLFETIFLLLEISSLMKSEETQLVGVPNGIRQIENERQRMIMNSASLSARTRPPNSL